MRTRFMALVIVVATILAFSSTTFAQRGGGRGGGRGGAANATPSGPPKDPHDLQGIWGSGGGPLGNDPPPFTPEGERRYLANKPSYGPRAVPPALGNDPMGICDPNGYPRSMQLRPFEIIQIPGRMFQTFEWNYIWREIWMDGRELPKDPTPRWMGYSVARWDGDTLVITSNGFDDRTWLTQEGHPHSDQMTMEERYRRVRENVLEMQMTITDPVTYTKPWVGEKKGLQLLPPGSNSEIRQELCVPSEEAMFNKGVRDPAGGRGAVQVPPTTVK